MAHWGSRPIRIREFIAYGLGDLASVLFLRFFGFYLFYYYVDLKGISPAAIGLMLLLTRVFDAVTDPGMGILADRTRSRWGRYRPYILIGAIPYGFAGFLVFSAPDLSDIGLLVWAYVTYSLSMLLYTIVNVPYSGLLGVISPKAAERETATTYRFVFAAFSDIVMALVATTIVREVGQGDEAYGITMAMGAIAAIASILLLACFANTRERIAPPVTNSSPKTDLATLIRIRAWLVVLVCAITVMIGIAAHATSAIFYLRYVGNDDGEAVLLFLDSLGLFMGVSVFSAVGAVIGRLLLKSYEKRVILIASMLAQGVFKLGYLLIPADSLTLVLLLNVGFNLGLGVALVVLFSMYTDIARHIHWKHDLQMTALVVSASMFAMKLGGAIGGAVPGFIMEATDFAAGQPQQELATWGILVSFGAIPAVFLFLGGYVARFYDITGEKLAQIELELAERDEGRTAT